MERKTTKGYELKTIKLNGVLFKGQYAEAIKTLEHYGVVTIKDFNNGSWDATKQIRHFINLLNRANIKVKIYGDSLRSTQIYLF